MNCEIILYEHIIKAEIIQADDKSFTIIMSDDVFNSNKPFFNVCFKRNSLFNNVFIGTKEYNNFEAIDCVITDVDVNKITIVFKEVLENNKFLKMKRDINIKNILL